MNKNFGCTKGEEMKNVKRNVIVSAFMAIALCMSVVAGATFALFTSDSSVNIAITSGNVEVTATASALKVYSPKAVNETGIADGDNAVDENGGRFVNGGTATLTGSELKLDNMTPGDKVNFNIKVENKSSVTVKYRTRIYCGEDNGLYAGLKYSITNGTETYESMAITDWATLTPDVKEVANLDCKVELPVDAGNEYKNKSCKLVYQVEAVQGNAETANDTKYYTLAQFNALTEIPAGVKNVYLNIGAVSLKNGSVVVGNEDMADLYTSVTGEYTVGQTLEDGRKIVRVWSEEKKIYLANSNKNGIKLYVSGSVNDNNDYGLNNIGDGPFPNSLTFKIPDASSIIFEKDFTVNGYFRMSPSWNDNKTLGGGVASHEVESVRFEGSTFNGIWIQNGGFATRSLTLDGCTFNNYENKKYPNDSNPLWFCNINTCDITIKNCEFNSSRPIKVVEQSVDGANVTIENNTFNMGYANSANESGKSKNAAIMFSTITNDSTLGNVVVSGNKVNGGVALLAFFNPSQITMAEGATFVVSGNTLASGVKLSVVWKSATEYLPTFVEAA